ncbi:hypothetical protein HYZ97_00205 [Candidatus Pacearchaeota archaeon]|nr:hypothetical protein [Candidatus Pacearchaeota archaeon]
MVANKHVFWQAFLLTIVVFGMGVLLGFFLESYRADVVQEKLLDSEISLADEQLRNRLISDFSVKCDIAQESTFAFADKIYAEARLLEQYDSANTFQDVLGILHRRYDLLRMLLWTESIKLKQGCNSTFHTVVYLYEYESEDVTTRAQQTFYSRMLGDLKNEHPEEILLIPLAVNTNLSSIDLHIQNYDVTSLPAIVIDEQNVVTGVVTLEEIEERIFSLSSSSPLP